MCTGLLLECEGVGWVLMLVECRRQTGASSIQVSNKMSRRRSVWFGCRKDGYPKENEGQETLAQFRSWFRSSHNYQVTVVVERTGLGRRRWPGERLKARQVRGGGGQVCGGRDSCMHGTRCACRYASKSERPNAKRWIWIRLRFVCEVGFDTRDAEMRVPVLRKAGNRNDGKLEGLDNGRRKEREKGKQTGANPCAAVCDYY